MPYIDPEVITEAKRIDLLTYLQNYEPDELVQFSGNTYTTRTHDSLKISNGKWMWWSRGIGGRSALDYLIKVKGMNFLDAVQTVGGLSFTIEPVPCIENHERKKSPVLPRRSCDSSIITGYLLKRGIDLEIIKYCFENDLIYESLPYHNLVFIGRDKTGKIRHASYRSANDLKIKGDVTGSDKRYSFHLTGSNRNEVHVFEGAIDALSYLTLVKLEGGDWREKNVLSLSGIYFSRNGIGNTKIPPALERFIFSAPELKKIVLHLDSDEPGRQATADLKSKLSENYEVIDAPPACGKDFNDFLCMKKQKLSNLKKERREER